MLTALLLLLSLSVLVWIIFGPFLGWLLILDQTPEVAFRLQVGLVLWNFFVVVPFWLFGTALVDPTPYTLHAQALSGISFDLLFLSFVGGLAGCFSVMSQFTAWLSALFLFFLISFGSSLYENVNALVRPTYDLHTYQVTRTYFDPLDHSVSVGLARFPHDPGEDFRDERVSLSDKGKQLLVQQNEMKQLTVNVLSRRAFLPHEVAYPASHASRRLFDQGSIAYTLLYPLLSSTLLWFAAASTRRSRKAMRKVR